MASCPISQTNSQERCVMQETIRKSRQRDCTRWCRVQLRRLGSGHSDVVKPRKRPKE
jgi:hypothetical protein